MMRRLFFFVIAAVVLLSACQDNDSFSNDRGLRLTFAVDTVKMDTMFSTVPSATYNFWVYNKSGNGIRISTVRLERGNQSGFRVNVDGTFLDPVANELEVRKDDSIRVFVEVTPPEAYTVDPKLIEDNLLFTLESGVEQRVNLRTWSWDAEKLMKLVVTRDTVIESSKPVVVYGDSIRIKKGATLTLRNTSLYFHDQTGIAVEGRLIAENCLMRGDRLDHMFDYLPYDRVSGQWSGIKVYPDASCELKDCEIRNPFDGMMCYANSKVTLVNTVIHNCRGYGFHAEDAVVSLSYCQMSNTYGDCLSLQGCQAVVDHCTLAQFYLLSSIRGAAIDFGDTEKPLSLNCTNTLMTGYNEDVLMGMKPSETVQYVFENCLIRTPKIDNEETFKNIIWETPEDEFEGTDHFLLVDDKNLIYDFTIKEESPAYAPGIGRSFVQKEDQETEQQQPSE